MPGRATGASTLGPTPAVQPRAVAARRRSASRRRQTATAERLAIYALAGAAGVTGALADAAVVPDAPLAAALRATFGVGMVLAGSRARRWTWLVMAGVAVLVAAEPRSLAVAAGGLGVAVASSLVRRRRIHGALSVALSLQGLFHMVALDDTVVAVTVLAVGTVPVLVSAYLVSPRRVRRRVHGVGLALLGLLVAAGGGAAVAAALVYDDATTGSAAARRGLDAVRSGDTRSATSDLTDAEAAFDQPVSVLDAPWLWPTRLVPGLAQQLDALGVLATEGRAVASASVRVTELVDYDRLRYTDGRIDLTAVRAVEPPLTDAAATMARAAEAVRPLVGAPLAPPLADAVADFAIELERAAPEADVAAAAAAVAPAMLGGDGPRRVAVLFTTPAELRGLGGFVGSWSILEARDGKVELVETYRTRELIERAGPGGLELVVPPDADEVTTRQLTDYLYRYQRFEPGRYLQDLTFSPDLPTVGAVVAQLLPQIELGTIDGVIVADPEGLAALLELTGPVRVEGYAGAVTADNVVDFLLREQYTAFPDRDERADFLGEIGAATFDALVSGSLPPPDEIGAALGPAVREGHLGVWSIHPDEQALLARVGATLAFPTVDGTDLLSVRTQNKGNNKIDVFQRRDVDHEVRFDPGTGEVRSTVTVTIHNDAPAFGLPDAVIGSNDQGLPPGTSVVYASVYTPLALEEASLDGTRVGVEFHRELGVSVYSRYIELRPGRSATLSLELTGRLAPGSYELVVSPQPTVNADQYRLGVEPASRWRLTDTETQGTISFGHGPDGGRAMGTGSLRTIVTFTAMFRER